MATIISKVKNFSKSKLSFSTPHLLTMQKETWEDFWKVRIKELLEEILKSSHVSFCIVKRWGVEKESLDFEKFFTLLIISAIYKFAVERVRLYKLKLFKIILKDYKIIF